MSTSLELHGAKTGNCLRVSIALEEASLSYKVRPVDLAWAQHRSDGHLSLNPAGKVPVLVEPMPGGNRFVLSQSNAILLYIAQKSSSGLLPDDPQNRGRAYERFFYFVTDVIAPSHASFALRSGQSPQATSLLNERAISALQFADTFVRRSRYMAGDQFSIADISALTIAGSLSSSLDWLSVPNLQRWFYEVAERPAVQRGLKAFDGIAPLA